MKILYPLTFEFGKMFREPITEKELALYLFIANTIIPGEEFQIAKTDTGGESLIHYTFPIYKNTEQEDPDYISEYFLKWCNGITKLTSDAKLIDDSSLISIDIRGINREQQVYHLSWAVKHILSKEPNNKVRIILICDSVPSKEDALFKHIYSMIQEGKMVLIDENGNMEAIESIPSLDKDKFSSILNLAEEDIKEKLRGKLIKKVGHYRIDEKRKICSKYFYDAKYCGNEITKLMQEYVENGNGLVGNLEYILYSSSMSPWLGLFMSAFSGDLEADKKDIFTNYKGAYNIDIISNELFDNYKGGAILLVVDFINSAETIKTQIVKIFDRFKPKGLTNVNLKLLAILNNEDGKSGNSKRKVVIINDEFEIDYFLGVTQNEDPEDECDKCRYGYEHNSVFEDEYIKFRSYDFWKLADEFGFEMEKFKPAYDGRERINLVPSFINWLKTYAPYLAFKFKNYIEHLDINKQLNFAVVFPDETVRDTGEECSHQDSASMLLAHKINEIFGISIVGIPRSAIDAVKKKQMKMSDIKDSEASWKTRIINMPPNTDIIILDEFLKDGGTLDSIISILQWLNKPAKCFFSIADLNPQKSKSLKNMKDGFEVLSLYDLNYN